MSKERPKTISAPSLQEALLTFRRRSQSSPEEYGPTLDQTSTGKSLAGGGSVPHGGGDAPGDKEGSATATPLDDHAESSRTFSWSSAQPLPPSGVQMRSQHGAESRVALQSGAEAFSAAVMAAAPALYVKRPMNSFMVWSKDERQRLARLYPEHQNADISRMLGERWGKMTPAEKEPYVEQARMLRQHHAQAFPDYRYRPKRKRGEEMLELPPPTSTIHELESGPAYLPSSDPAVSPTRFLAASMGSGLEPQLSNGSAAGSLRARASSTAEPMVSPAAYADSAYPRPHFALLSHGQDPDGSREQAMLAATGSPVGPLPSPGHDADIPTFALPTAASQPTRRSSESPHTVETAEQLRRLQQQQQAQQQQAQQQLLQPSHRDPVPGKFVVSKSAAEGWELVRPVFGDLSVDFSGMWNHVAAALRRDLGLVHLDQQRHSGGGPALSSSLSSISSFSSSPPSSVPSAPVAGAARRVASSFQQAQPLAQAYPDGRLQHPLFGYRDSSASSARSYTGSDLPLSADEPAAVKAVSKASSDTTPSQQQSLAGPSSCALPLSFPFSSMPLLPSSCGAPSASSRPSFFSSSLSSSLSSSISPPHYSSSSSSSLSPDLLFRSEASSYSRSSPSATAPFSSFSSSFLPQTSVLHSHSSALSSRAAASSITLGAGAARQPHADASCNPMAGSDSAMTVGPALEARSPLQQLWAAPHVHSSEPFDFDVEQLPLFGSPIMFSQGTVQAFRPPDARADPSPLILGPGPGLYQPRPEDQLSPQPMIRRYPGAARSPLASSGAAAYSAHSLFGYGVGGGTGGGSVPSGSPMLMEALLPHQPSQASSTGTPQEQQASSSQSLQAAFSPCSPHAGQAAPQPESHGPHQVATSPLDAEKLQALYEEHEKLQQQTKEVGRKIEMLRAEARKNQAANEPR